jgi:hypothetical protein
MLSPLGMLLLLLLLLVIAERARAQSIPTPNLPPGPKCYNLCPEDMKPVVPKDSLAIYVFALGGCRRDEKGLVSSSQYSRDTCGWDYPGHSGGCAATPQVGCTQSNIKSVMLPRGAHVKLYAQCNILYHYEPDTISVLDDFQNTGSDWKCFDLQGKPAVSVHIIELGHDTAGWGWSFVVVVLGGFALYLSAGTALNHRKQQKGAAAGIVSLLPHLEFWYDVLGMTRDGVVFTRARLTGRPMVATAGSGSRSQLRQHLLRGEPVAEGGGKENSSKRSQSGGSKKSSKKSSKDSSPSSSRSKKDGSSKDGDTQGEGTAIALPVTASSAQTVAGGGGRWVHVS